MATVCVPWNVFFQWTVAYLCPLLHAVAADGQEYTVVHLCGLLLRGLNDEIATATRAAVVALRSCVPLILQSTEPGLALELMRCIFRLKFNPYWLLKEEVRGGGGEPWQFFFFFLVTPFTPSHLDSRTDWRNGLHSGPPCRNFA